jgi:hypothetical protein
LKSLLKAFVTIGASGTAAPGAAGHFGIPHERYFAFSVQQAKRDRFTEAQKQAVANRAEKKFMDGLHESFEICIDSLREKQSLSTPYQFLI